MRGLQPTLALVVFTLACPALAEVCDKFDERSGFDRLVLLGGPAVACVVATLLVARGSTLAAALATVLAIAGARALSDEWALIEAAQAEPCGPGVLVEGRVAAALLFLLFAVPNGLWTVRRVKASRRPQPPETP